MPTTAKTTTKEAPKAATKPVAPLEEAVSAPASPKTTKKAAPKKAAPKKAAPKKSPSKEINNNPKPPKKKIVVEEPSRVRSRRRG